MFVGVFSHQAFITPAHVRMAGIAGLPVGAECSVCEQGLAEGSVSGGEARTRHSRKSDSEKVLPTPL